MFVWSTQHRAIARRMSALQLSSLTWTTRQRCWTQHMACSAIVCLALPRLYLRLRLHGQQGRHPALALLAQPRVEHGAPCEQHASSPGACQLRTLRSCSVCERTSASRQCTARRGMYCSRCAALSRRITYRCLKRSRSHAQGTLACQHYRDTTYTEFLTLWQPDVESVVTRLVGSSTWRSCIARVWHVSRCVIQRWRAPPCLLASTGKCLPIWAGCSLSLRRCLSKYTQAAWSSTQASYTTSFSAE